ncbi:MAG: ABC transporter substrate-binding protein [Candidatus Bathyarchaeota archaeon]|nr:ABC transporter substrate-binding protein [Candidatus Bathyarchaeota archaeon]
MTAKTKTLLFCSLLVLSLFSLPGIMFVQSQSAPYFKITLIVPGPNPSRKAWAQIVENSLDEVGIDAVRVELDWDTVYSRALTPDEDTVGKTYDEGGFDALFVGYAMGVDPDPFPMFDSSQFPPTGQNYYLWNNAENDRLGRLIKEEPDLNKRLQYVKEWQKLAYDEQPCATILYTKEVVAFDPTALQKEPFTAYHYPAWPRVKNWKLASGSTQTTIVVAQTGPAPSEGLNPLLSTSYYDLTVYDNVFDSLAERWDLIDFKMVPALATSWEVASDQKTWTVHLRQGVKWHDGVDFTADDVKFTYDSFMNDAVSSPVGAFIKEIIGGPENVEVVDSNTVVFRLPKIYAYFVESILSYHIIPKHVLQNVAPANWKTHAFNTASGSYTVGSYTAYGPIGTGPYVYAAYDPTTAANVLTKNTNYWNKAELEGKGTFGIEVLYVQHIESSDAALSALKTGVVDVLDSQYHLETKLSSIEKPWGDYVSYDAFGVQELGFNMRHPVFGTGVDTPLGKQNPSRAAEAARYVRQAISHLIPRQQIIDTIIAGYGSPGLTTPITRVTAGYDTSLEPYSYDVTLAKSLLAAAGYDTGVAPPAGDFLQQYGLYIAVIVVVVVVAVVAMYALKKRR